MAYLSANLTVQGLSVNGDGSMWLYTHPTDSVDTITASGYFNDATNKLQINDNIAILGATATTPVFARSRVSALGTVTLTGWSAAATQGAAPAGGTGATAGAYDTAANRNSLIDLVNQMRLVLIAHGLMKGAA